jgi:sugar lactone lactonase YvrE
MQDGAGATAMFNNPMSLATDANGDIYVGDTNNHRVRKITISGDAYTVSTVAGTGAPGYVDSPPGATDSTGVLLNAPYGLAIGADGTIFVADQGNSTIRRITQAGVTSTFAGSGQIGFVDGIGTGASFNRPTNLALDKTGTLYVGDSGNINIRKITADGLVTTVMRSIPFIFETQGIAISPSGYLYITSQCRIFSIPLNDPNGTATLFAGTYGQGNWDGPALEARFNWGPYGLAIDSDGNMYVADTDNGLIRKVSPTL